MKNRGPAHFDDIARPHAIGAPVTAEAAR